MNRQAYKAQGLSLIELMIAMVIGLVLMIGMLRVFAASREAARMAEGLSRVQENSRFALDFLQRDLRMIGHMGCVNDQFRLLQGIDEINYSGFQLSGTPLRVPERLDFLNGVRGYEAANTAPGSTTGLTISASRPTAPAAAGNWTPALPSYLLGTGGLVPAPLPGSDIIEVRYFSASSVPVLNVTGNGTNNVTIQVDQAQWNKVMLSDGYTAGNLSLMGISDCANMATFQLTTAPTGGAMSVRGNQGLNRDVDGGGIGFPFVAGQTALYRAESSVYYVAWPDGHASPSLYRARFVAAPGGTALVQLGGGGSEELVEGIESLQMLYGTDLELDAGLAPLGYIAEQQAATATTAWNRVGLIQVAVLSRSNERASSDQVSDKSLLGVELNLPEDGRYRSVYESTIALRNRLFGGKR